MGEEGDTENQEEGRSRDGKDPDDVSAAATSLQAASILRHHTALSGFPKVNFQAKSAFSTRGPTTGRTARGSELQLLQRREGLPRSSTNCRELRYQNWRGGAALCSVPSDPGRGCRSQDGPRPSGAT